MSDSSSSRHRLIITADDCGYSVERDRGIIECFKNGAITTASLLINGVAAMQACYVARQYGMPVGKKWVGAWILCNYFIFCGTNLCFALQSLFKVAFFARPVNFSGKCSKLLFQTSVKHIRPQ